MPPIPVSADPIVGQNIGGYIVEEALGEGAVGLVYRARHPVLNRHFAIKVLRPEFAADATSSSNFAREAQTLASLKHPAIIDIVDFGPMSDGRQYMVMEYLPGRTLERELQEEGRLSPERALKLSDEILDALSAAHAVDVIHRDLKPSNVFLEKLASGREVVKLLDFGLAKQRPALLLDQVGPASDTSIAGTPEYIAPEQAYGQAASRQSDLYSFGIILFRMLTGSLPFTADLGSNENLQVLGLMKKHVHQAPPTLQAAAVDVDFPEGLAEVVAELLKKKPSERPLSADALRKRLARISRGEVMKPRPIAGVPVRKVRRPGLMFGAMVILPMVLGAAWWWGEGSRPIEVAPVAPVAAPEVIAAPTPPPEVPPAVPEVKAEPLEDLSVIPVKARKPLLVPADAADCEPDEDWKKRSRAELDELMGRASLGDLKLALWAADHEGLLSSEIEAASDEIECRAVVFQLGTFKEKVTRK